MTEPAGAAAIVKAVAAARIVASPPEDADSGRLNLELAGQVRNDIGNAERLVARKGADLAFVKDAGWYGWTGTRWSRADGDRLAQIAAQETAIAIFAEANAMRGAGPRKDAAGNLKETAADHAERVAGHRKWAAASGKAERLAAMLRCAAPWLAKGIDEMDAEPFALTVANGTLELDEKVSFRGHERADWISRLAPVIYDPEAAAPRCRQLLDEVLPDPAVRRFVQTWSGYMLTGATVEQCLVLLYGRGQNGKSKYLEAMRGIMGDYAAALPSASLLHDDHRRGSEATPDFARLPAVRFVSTVEPRKGARLDEGFIKSLTGGDPIMERHLHHDFFEYKPQFKLCLAFNDKPTIRGQDKGIWRRLILIPFEVEIPDDRKDKHLGDKLRAEYPGILNWALDGFRLWREGGLAMPERVASATAEYRDDLDQLGPFLAATCEPAAGERVRFKDLYAAYCGWCHANAQSPLSASWLGRSLIDRGYPRVKSVDIYYVGLRIVRNYTDHRTEDEAMAAGADMPPP